MFGVSLFAPTGPGGIGRPVSLPDIPGNAERCVDHLEERVEAGKLNLDALDRRLQARFGDAAQGIVGEDGSVDFERLEKLIVETRSEKLQERLTARFGDAAEGIVSPDGSVDTEQLRDLFAEHRFEKIIEKLKEKFGDRVDGVIGEGGAIDASALKELIADSTDDTALAPAPSEPAPSAEPGPAPDVESPVADESDKLEQAESAANDSAPAAPVEDSGDAADATDVAETKPPETGEPRGLRASERLAELRETLFEARLERHFGRDLPDIFGDDGGIDFDALRRLFDENGPGHTYGRPGPKHPPYPGRPTLPRPFFELRA